MLMNMEKYAQPTGNQELRPWMLVTQVKKLRNSGKKNMLSE